LRPASSILTAASFSSGVDLRPFFAMTQIYMSEAQLSTNF
jgi:hypothetical protein